MQTVNFGQRLLEVRKNKKLSQDELAKKIGVHGAVIGRYERGEVKPSIEMAAKIAQTLGISLDYLVGNTDQELDREILDKVVEIQRLSATDKDYIFFALSAMLRDAKAHQAYSH